MRHDDDKDYSSERVPVKESWHLNRSVPVVLIVVIISSLVTVTLYLSKLESGIHENASTIINHIGVDDRREERQNKDLDRRDEDFKEFLKEFKLFSKEVVGSLNGVKVELATLAEKVK